MDIYLSIYLWMCYILSPIDRSIDQFFSFFVAERERIFEHRRVETTAVAAAATAEAAAATAETLTLTEAE